MPNPSCFSMSEKEISHVHIPLRVRKQVTTVEEIDAIIWVLWRLGKRRFIGVVVRHWRRGLLEQLRSHKPGTCFSTIQKRLDRVSPWCPMLPKPKEATLRLLLSGRF